MGRRRESTGTLLWAILFPVLLAACGPPGDRTAGGTAHLRVGVLPDEAEQRLRRLYDPLLAYLAASTGLGFELHVPANYEALLETFDRGELDLVWFGGLTFSRAQVSSNAQPLVSRDTDVRFTTSFVVASDAEGDSLEAFAGESLAFGPRLSTSGHLMARAFLDARGIRPEAFFESVKYSARHDETAAWVRDGVVAIGVVNSAILQTLLRTGRLGGNDVKIVSTTPPYQNYVWATRATLDTDVRQTLLEAFLALDPAVPEHAVLLDELGADGFLPVGSDAYLELQQVVSEVGSEHLR